MDERLYNRNKSREKLLVNADVFNNVKYYVVTNGAYPSLYIEISSQCNVNAIRRKLNKLVHGGVTYERDFLEVICDGTKKIFQNAIFLDWDYAHSNDLIVSSDDGKDILGVSHTYSELVNDVCLAISKVKSKLKR